VRASPRSGSYGAPQAVIEAEVRVRVWKGWTRLTRLCAGCLPGFTEVAAGGMAGWGGTQDGVMRSTSEFSRQAWAIEGCNRGRCIRGQPTQPVRWPRRTRPQRCVHVPGRCEEPVPSSSDAALDAAYQPSRCSGSCAAPGERVGCCSKATCWHHRGGGQPVVAAHVGSDVSESVPGGRCSRRPISPFVQAQ